MNKFRRKTTKNFPQDLTFLFWFLHDECLIFIFTEFFSYFFLTADSVMKNEKIPI